MATTVEQRIAAIEAISKLETDSMLSQIRLVRSCYNREQLQMPVLKFFEQNLTNLSVVRNDKYHLYELQWKGVDAFDFEHAATFPIMDGLEFSVKSVKESLLTATSLQIPSFALDELLETQYQELRDLKQTPGATGHTNSSVGMTPKSVRLPKHGELLLSVCGSPLGMYREENLQVIHECGDDSTNR